MVLPGAGLLKLPVRFVDRAQQLLETGRFLDRPCPVEGRAEKIELAAGEQADGDDAVVHWAVLFH